METNDQRKPDETRRRSLWLLQYFGFVVPAGDPKMLSILAHLRANLKGSTLPAAESPMQILESSAVAPAKKASAES